MSPHSFDLMLQCIGIFLCSTLVFLAGRAVVRRSLQRRLRELPGGVTAAAEPAPLPEPPISWISNRLLPALDGLDDAIAAAQASPNAQLLIPFVVGVQMVQLQLFRALRVYEVEPVEARPGDAFDPAFHQAVEVVVSADQPPGTIAAILRRGYILPGSRLLRPAAVLVTKKEEECAGTGTSSAAVALTALAALLLSGCFETSYIGGWLLGRQSAQGTKPAAATAAQPDAGVSSQTTPNN